MKKIFFFFIPLLLCAHTITAQQFSVEKSAEFDEPEFGWNKLLQLKNGNTMYFHSTKKDGIELTVYNKMRKQIAQKTLVSKLWDVEKMKRAMIKGLYEINGEAVLFVMQADDREPTLYRMRINGTNGAIMKEDELGHLPKVTMGMGFAVVYGHMDMPDIIVEKDPETDNYAAIFFNTQAHDRSERIRVVHYDGAHKVLNNAFYESPNNQFKYMRYIGCVVDGSKRVYLTTYGHNGNSEDMTSRVIVSVLNAGDSSFKHKLLDFSEDFNDTKSVMQYNHSNNKIQLLTLTYSHSKTKMISGDKKMYYTTLLTYLDPETLAIISTKPVEGKKIAAYAAKNIDKDYEYHGLPQNIIINKDNSVTLLMEEVKLVSQTHYSGHMQHTTQYTELGPVGISELNDTGMELQGYAINKRQKAEGEFPLLYLSQRSKGLFNYAQRGFQSSDNNEFLSYDYVNAPNGHYAIFNDLPGNFDRDEDETKRKMTTKVSATNTICFKLNGDNIDKFYLFGEPDDKHSATFSYIQSSDYNKETSTYATLIVQKDGRDKSARIAWVTFK